MGRSVAVNTMNRVVSGTTDSERDPTRIGQSSCPLLQAARAGFEPASPWTPTRQSDHSTRPRECHEVRGVHSPIGDTLLSLPPLPHDRYGIRGGLHCGGEGRGEGARADDMAPSPQPSPPQRVPQLIDIDRGGEGAGRGPPLGECTRFTAHSTLHSNRLSESRCRP